MAWDNEVLRASGERTNPAPTVAPTIPEPGSERALALAALLAGAGSVGEIARRARVNEPRARALLDRLRADGWWVESAGGGRFSLVAHQIAA